MRIGEALHPGPAMTFPPQVFRPSLERLEIFAEDWMLCTVKAERAAASCAIEAVRPGLDGRSARATLWIDRRFMAAGFQWPAEPCLLGAVRPRPGSPDFILDFRGVAISCHVIPVTLEADGTWTTAGLLAPPGAA